MPDGVSKEYVDAIVAASSQLDELHQLRAEVRRLEELIVGRPAPVPQAQAAPVGVFTTDYPKEMYSWPYFIPTDGFITTSGGVFTGPLSVVNPATQFSTQINTDWTVCYPVANSPSPGTNGEPAVEAQFVVQGQTSQGATIPEWTAVFGNYVNTGSPGGQKVSVYSGVVQGPNGGAVWSLNTDVVRNGVPGPGSNVPGGPSGIGSSTPGTPGSVGIPDSTIGYELDFCNWDRDCPPGGAFTVGMYVHVQSIFASLAGIYFDSTPLATNNFAWHNGIEFAGQYTVQDNTIFDNSSSHYSYQSVGNHAGATFYANDTGPLGLVIAGNHSAADIQALDSAPVVLSVYGGTHTNVVDVSNTAISGVAWNGNFSATGINSTPIGATTGSTGSFTTLQGTTVTAAIAFGAESLTSISGAQWQQQGAWMAWNYQGGSGFNGESDYINSRGGGSGGHAWFTTASTSGSTPTLLAKLDVSGNFTASGIIATGSVSGAGFTNLFAAPPPIGNTTPAYGAFTQVVGTRSGGATTSAFVADCAGNATYAWYDTSGATDAKKYDVLASGGTLYFRLISDSEGTANTWMSLTRTGAAATQLNVAAPNISLQGAVASTGGLSLGSTVGANNWDFSHGIALYGGSGSGYGINVTGGEINYAVPASSTHAFIVNGTQAASITASSATGITVGAAGAPNIRAGAGAATGTQPSGSIWMRTDGSAGARLYVTSGGGTWVAVASV